MVEKSGAFFSQFDFRPDMRGAVGIEREYFLAHKDGGLAPDAADFLAVVDDEAWTYELSACQVEHRTRPHFADDLLRQNLQGGQEQGEREAALIGRKLVVHEVGPIDMPLDVFPTDRYLAIAAAIPLETLRAACRVTGTHLHFGAKSLDEAIEWHNRVRTHIGRLAELADHSSGERIRLYKMMAKNWEPPQYDSAEHFYEIARSQGFADNPRNCWHIVRISRHGTVELRMFGMTGDADEILGWVAQVRQLLK